MIRACFRYIFALKVFSPIKERPYLGFENFFDILGRNHVLFNTIADFNPNISIFFQQFIIFNQNINPFSFTIITFYISNRFWKHFAKWFNFTAISIFVINKILITFSPEETILDTCILSIPTSSNKIRFL